MKGLTSNKLKIIAIILMILDHIGYYFVSYISKETFDILRFFGRMAMPVFAFLIVQGFFHTKDIKMYMFKLFITATIFQGLLFGLGIINHVYVPNFYIVINTYLNILYSFVLSLIILWLIDKKDILKNKWLNNILKIVGISLVVLVYFLVDLELGLRVPVTILGFYIAEKIKRSGKSTELSQVVMLITLVLALFADYKNLQFNLPSVLSLFVISLYNGERGKKNKWISTAFYVFYPLHHVILYVTALTITHIVR